MQIAPFLKVRYLVALPRSKSISVKDPEIDYD